MTALLTLLDRAVAGQDLTEAEGIQLIEQRDPQARAAIRQAADTLRQELVGQTVTYVVNRNLNFTNICEQHCSFCAFRRDADQAGAYWLSEAQMLARIQAAVQAGATEICIQGGLNPQAKRGGSSLAFYTHLIQTLRGAFPHLHLHAFSPQEIQFIAREDGLSWETVLRALQAAGVGSLPGTAAEVLDDQVRRVLCPEKIDTATWLAIVQQAHALGLPTTSTLLSGHIETSAQRIHHLAQLRQLQQVSRAAGRPGFSEFILLPFVGQSAPAMLRKRVGRDQPCLMDALHTTAVARLFLGSWIINHQPSWVKLGLAGATEALTWGCNDLGGTLMEEHISTAAGAQGGTAQTVTDLQGAIRSLGRPFQERTTLYQPISSVQQKSRSGTQETGFVRA